MHKPLSCFNERTEVRVRVEAGGLNDVIKLHKAQAPVPHNIESEF